MDRQLKAKAGSAIGQYCHPPVAQGGGFVAVRVTQSRGDGDPERKDAEVGSLGVAGFLGVGFLGFGGWFKLLLLVFFIGFCGGWDLVGFLFGLVLGLGLVVRRGFSVVTYLELFCWWRLSVEVWFYETPVLPSEAPNSQHHPSHCVA